MGFLTPILVYNDYIHILENKKLQKKICEEIYSVCLQNKEQDIIITNMKSLGCRHADHSRVIIVHGNTWKDITKESYKEINRIDDGYIEYLEECKRIIESDLDSLKSRIKQLKQRNKESKNE